MLPPKKTSVPSSFHDHIESNITVSILLNTSFHNTNAYYEAIPSTGRELGVTGIKLYPHLAASQSPSSSSAPKLRYNIYTFMPTSLANITVYINPTLNTNPNRPVKYAIAIDGEKPQTI